MSGDFTGLMLVYARTGVPWRWAGHEVVASWRAGGVVRVERWRTACRCCGEDFVSTAKLGAKMRARYLAALMRAREAGEAPDVRIVVPRGQRIANFELRNCKPCREALRLV